MDNMNYEHNRLTLSHMSIKESDKDDRFQITEMFMAEAGKKCFYGIIKRSQDANGNPHLFSRIIINDGIVQACSSEQKMLCSILDEMCAMYLKGLNKDTGVFQKILGEKYFLN
jgi:hypothetical protein